MTDTWPPDWAADEEARAELWRQQQRRRWDFQYGLWRSLAGNRAAMRHLIAMWQALIDAMAEAQAPLFPGDDDPEVDVMNQSDTVNVGN